MPPRFTDADLSALVPELKRENADRDAKLELRNLLIYRRDGDDQASGTAVATIPPFDRSKLILTFRTTEVSDAAARIVAALTANRPNFEINRILTSDRKVSEKANRNAAHLELGLNASYGEADRRGHLNERIAWSQVTELAGWYLTTPAEAGFGLPDRRYYEDLTDDEIDELKRTGDITPSRITDPADGLLKFAETADTWRARRRQVMEDKAVRGESLMVDEALSAGKVYVRRDNGPGGGFKLIAVMEMVPTSEFGPGSDLARQAAQHLGIEESEAAQYGLWLDKDGGVVGGVEAGGADEFRSDPRQRWLLARVFTRDEVYVFVMGATMQGAGKIIQYQRHHWRRVPLFEVPGVVTTSDMPGEDRLPLLDGMIALSPLINAVTSLLSLQATWNSLPRWVIEMPNGELLADPKTGEPLVMEFEKPAGLDPQLTQIIRGGTIRQLTIDDKGLLIKLLEFFYARLALSAPSQAETGVGGVSSPAWTLRQMQEASAARNNKLVEYHAEALAEMARFKINLWRQLDVPIIWLAAPGFRKDMPTMRGLIEFDPADASLDVTVRQSANTPDQVTVVTQVAKELWKEGVITQRQMYERMEIADPDAQIFEMDIEKIVEMVMLSSAKGLDPESVLAQTARLVRGELIDEILKEAPRLANALAAVRAEEARLQAAQQAQTPGVPDGNTLGGAITDVAGIREPAVSMPTGLEDLNRAPAPAAPEAPVVV